MEIVILLAAGYALLCLLVGVAGRPTRAGFWGTVVVSVLITPFAAFLLLLLFSPRSRRGQPCEPS